MNKAYQVITDRIIEKLEKGTVPWRQPWAEPPIFCWPASARPASEDLKPDLVVIDDLEMKREACSGTDGEP